MIRTLRRIGEWSARALAVAAVTIAFRPVESLSDVTAQVGLIGGEEDLVSDLVGPVNIESNDDDPPPAAH